MQPLKNLSLKASKYIKPLLQKNQDSKKKTTQHTNPQANQNCKQWKRKKNLDQNSKKIYILFPSNSKETWLCYIHPIVQRANFPSLSMSSASLHTNSSHLLHSCTKFLKELSFILSHLLHQGLSSRVQEQCLI